MRITIIRFYRFGLFLFLWWSGSLFGDLHSSFGQTHFIVGAQSAQVRRHAKKTQLKHKLSINDHATRITRVFFSPDDDVRSVLLDLIACEKEAICMAAFFLTDATIAQALLGAHQRGVKVEVITDRMCCRGRHQKVAMLSRGGIDTFVYAGRDQGGRHMSDIMHNKFVVFKKNLLGRSFIWTGSFNFTHSARLNNQENVLLLDDQAIAQQYLKQFALIKTRCAHYDDRIFGKRALTKTKRVRLKRIKKRKEKKIEA